MRLTRFNTPLLFLCLTGTAAVAQRPSESARGGVSVQVQPKIMVIPLVKEGEDLRKLIEADFNTRLALTAVKEGFDDRGFTTIDARAIIASLSNDDVIQSTSQSDLKSRVIEQSRADIYVEVDMQVQGGVQNQVVSLTTTSHLAANAMSLSNKSVTVGPFNGVPLPMIVTRAAKEKLEPFLTTMQEKFTGFVDNGVPIRMSISVAQGAKNLSREVGPNKDELGDAIEEWVSKNAYKNNYHIAGRTPLMINFDEVRIPLFDPGTNNNFNVSRFSLELVRHLRTLDVRAARSMTGGTIYVEIQ